MEIEKNTLLSEIFELLQEIYNIYLELILFEIDKGTSLYYHEFESFNKINEINKKNISKLEKLISKKEKLTLKICEILNLDKKYSLKELINKYFPEKVIEFNNFIKKFDKLINISSDINSKNIILLNTSSSFFQKLYDSITVKDKKPIKYNKNGNIDNKIEIIRFHAQV